LTQCLFASERGFGGVINENYVKMINAVTGWDLTLEAIEKIGERIYNLERVFNCREGVSRKDDALPYRTSTEPIPDGPSKGMHTPPEEFASMIEEYYRLRGWDSNGIPTREKLAALGLEETAKDLREMRNSE
jgi:aldehyde:ferredoxin oxidoreductase